MKIAVLFRGGISKKNGNFAFHKSIDAKCAFINYKCAHKSFRKHILEPNKRHQIDTFIHTWHPELEDELINLYKPKKILTEQNELYANEIIDKVNFTKTEESGYGAVSHALSLKKVSNLVRQYSEENNINYDLILIYRLDILLVVDLIFDGYNLSHITCNNFADCMGDFHFVMNYQNMIEFCKIYDFFSPNLQPVYHFHFPDYVRKYMGKILSQDNIVAGVFQEVLRKGSTLIEHNYINPQDLIKYGTTYEELLSYKH